MTTIGYRNIPFTVNVAMHSAIHAVHYVSLENAGDGRLTFPSGGTSMFFTPLNWMTPQPIVVNFNGVGDAELIASITNDYFVNGAGAHRTQRFIIDLSVTNLPLDAWYGTVPRWSATDGQGDLASSHDNLVLNDEARIVQTITTGVTYATGSGLATRNISVLVELPDHTTVVLSGASGYTYTMAQLGVYTFRPLLPFAVLNDHNVGSGVVIQTQTLEYQWLRGGIPQAPTSTVTAVSQGFAMTAASCNITGLSQSAGPISPQTLPVGGFAQATYLGTLSYALSGTPDSSNFSGSGAPSGDSIVFTGNVLSPGPWHFQYNNSGNSCDVLIDGVPAAVGFAAFTMFSI